MKHMIKPYLYRASAVSAFAVVAGLALSVMVYVSSEKVRLNGADLLDKRIPVLAAIQHLSADLSEHERIVYEYYASQNELSFITAINFNQKVIQAQVDKLYQKLYRQGLPRDELVQIKEHLVELDKNVAEFHQLMLVEEKNGLQIRAELAQISAVRQVILPYLSQLNIDNQLHVNRGQQATLAHISNTRTMVVTFGVAIIFLALLFAWYTRQHLLTSAFNTRLSLFSERNPNPVLSLDAKGDITYNNPACQQLLKQVGLGEQSVKALLPTDLLSRQSMEQRRSDFVLRVEHQLEQRHLLLEVNWLADLQSYDIHILDVTEQKNAQDEIKQLAFTHQESKLPNHYQLDSDIDCHIANQRHFTLGLVNISNYRAMVTRQGIECSNGVVTQLAHMLMKQKAGVNLYHTAENQFAIVWGGVVTNEHIQHWVSELSELVVTPIVTCNGEFFVELDFGVSRYPEHGSSASEVFKNAFTASLSAAELEHSDYVIFDSSLAEQIDKQTSLQDKLRMAQANDELFLVFQPQLDLASNTITGVETLVRWRHQGEIVSPAEFIPLAEQSGLIVSIGEWILNQACLFAKQLMSNTEVIVSNDDFVIAVNISPRQFSHPKFVELVERVLRETGLAAHHLELEITEGVFVDNEEAMLQVLKRLKVLGVQLSIDDFGTGYSSLAYLKQFPVDKLKIDQAFIRASHENNEDKVLVNTIIALGQNLGLKLIAEGVELIEHVEFLREAHCDEIQGYWFSRPLEKADLLAFLKLHASKQGTQPFLACQSL